MRSPMKWFVLPALLTMASCAIETGTADEHTGATDTQQGLSDVRPPEDSTKAPGQSTHDRRWQSGSVGRGGWNLAPGDPVPWNPPKDPDQPK